MAPTGPGRPPADPVSGVGRTPKFLPYRRAPGTIMRALPTQGHAMADDLDDEELEEEEPEELDEADLEDLNEEDLDDEDVDLDEDALDDDDDVDLDEDIDEDADEDEDDDDGAEVAERAPAAAGE